MAHGLIHFSMISLQGVVFERIRRIGICGLAGVDVGGSVSLGIGFEALKAHTGPDTVLSLSKNQDVASSQLLLNTTSVTSAAMMIMDLTSETVSQPH